MRGVCSDQTAQQPSKSEYIFLMADNVQLSGLKSELAFLEKRMSKIQQQPELERLAVDCANKIAALRKRSER
jgi:hypothetical protein